MKNKLWLWIGCLLLLLGMGAALWVRNQDALEQGEKSLPVREETWFEDYKVISHALGGIEGKDYTNSYEALEYSYQKGQRVVEADFRFTKDGVLVCRHDWKDDLGQESILGDQEPDLETFKNALIFGTYTPMTAEELISYMSSHPDLYLVTDVKHNLKSNELTNAMEEFVRLAKNVDASVLDRVIIQIYCEENYEKMEKVYPFKSYIFTLYKQKKKYQDHYDQLADFCKRSKISVVTMPAKWVKKEDDLKPLLENGIKVYVHTVNDLQQVQKMFDRGVTGIYSDYLYEEDIKELNGRAEDRADEAEKQ